MGDLKPCTLRHRGWTRRRLLRAVWRVGRVLFWHPATSSPALGSLALGPMLFVFDGRVRRTLPSLVLPLPSHSPVGRLSLRSPSWAWTSVTFCPSAPARPASLPRGGGLPAPLLSLLSLDAILRLDWPLRCPPRCVRRIYW